MRLFLILTTFGGALLLAVSVSDAQPGVVTRAELATFHQGAGGFGGDKGDKGKGEKGKGDKGDKDKGDKGKGKGGPRPGVVLSPFAQDMLNLTDAQRKMVDQLQKDVDARLEKILTAEQRQQLRNLSGPGDKKGPPPGDKKGPPPGDKKGPPPEKSF